MPFGMGTYLQSVLVEGTVYVGGGSTGHGSDSNYEIMAYNISSGQWTKLPPYRAHAFAMTVISNQLVLVGGVERGGDRSKVLGVWRADSKKWTHPYPNMLTSRAWCSAVAYKEWLVVAGGLGGSGDRLLSVEVMNIDNKQWYTAPPTPVAWSSMKTAIVGDTCYFMGGLIGSGYTNKVYSASLPALVSQLNSSEYTQIWKEILQLLTTRAAPLSISGSLLAVGGNDKGTYTNAILLYQPATREWVKVGGSLSPRSTCTCTMLTDREFFVAGGYSGSFSAVAYIGTIYY